LVKAIITAAGLFKGCFATLKHEINAFPLADAVRITFAE